MDRNDIIFGIASQRMEPLGYPRYMVNIECENVSWQMPLSEYEYKLFLKRLELLEQHNKRINELDKGMSFFALIGSIIADNKNLRKHIEDYHISRLLQEKKHITDSLEKFKNSCQRTKEQLMQKKERIYKELDAIEEKAVMQRL